MQTRLVRKFVDETELLPLLLADGLVRRVRTIQIEVRPLGGDSFKVTLDASKPTVGEAKAEVARSQGTAESRQELYRVAKGPGGLAVREDDAKPEPLEDKSLVLKDGDLVAMAVKVSSQLFHCSSKIIKYGQPITFLHMYLYSKSCHQEPLFLWRTYALDRVWLSEGGAVATQTHGGNWLLTTTGTELTEGKHYWEGELLPESFSNIFIGISRPNLDPTKEDTTHYFRECTDGWSIHAEDCALFGNGKAGNVAGDYVQGDRVGVLLDLDDGSLRFFKNGVAHGPGYPAGSVTGPVVAAVQMIDKDSVGVRLLPNAEAPADM
jgi:hypothetical protein